MGSCNETTERGSNVALINDPRKLFAYKLGTVLSGEKKILTMLKKLEKRAQREELRQQFRHHREETEGQIRNIEQAFKALGEKATGRQNPTITGLAEQADVLYDKTDDEILDTVLLGGAAETEHLEIALYEDLITQARAMGEQQVVSLLEKNLEQEQHTLEEVKRASEQLAQRSAGRPASAVTVPPTPSQFESPVQ
jgi:ferritin-like metal-binding protein YciE